MSVFIMIGWEQKEWKYTNCPSPIYKFHTRSIFSHNVWSNGILISFQEYVYTKTRSVVVLFLMNATYECLYQAMKRKLVNYSELVVELSNICFPYVIVILLSMATFIIISFICISVVYQTLLYPCNDMHIVYVVSVKRLPSITTSQNKNTYITLLSA